MTDSNKAAIMLVVDRSGSMYSLQDTAQDAINKFIVAQQVEDGTARTLTIAQFDTLYELVTPSTLAAGCPSFVLDPRGGTALLDAMGNAITDLGAELAALPEDQRPGTVILGLVTDGQENSSREYTWDTVQQMVRRQEDEYGWQIVYLAADQDAIATGAKMGVRAHRSMSYTSSNAGTTAVMDGFSRAVVTASAAGPGGQGVAFSDDEREAATADD